MPKGKTIYETQTFIIKLLETKSDGTQVYLQKYKNASWHETLLIHPEKGIMDRHETNEITGERHWLYGKKRR